MSSWIKVNLFNNQNDSKRNTEIIEDDDTNSSPLPSVHFDWYEDDFFDVPSFPIHIAHERLRSTNQALNKQDIFPGASLKIPMFLTEEYRPRQAPRQLRPETEVKRGTDGQGLKQHCGAKSLCERSCEQPTTTTLNSFQIHVGKSPSLAPTPTFTNTETDSLDGCTKRETKPEKEGAQTVFKFTIVETSAKCNTQSSTSPPPPSDLHCEQGHNDDLTVKVTNIIEASTPPPESKTANPSYIEEPE